MPGRPSKNGISTTARGIAVGRTDRLHNYPAGARGVGISERDGSSKSTNKANLKWREKGTLGLGAVPALTRIMTRSSHRNLICTMYAAFLSPEDLPLG